MLAHTTGSHMTYIKKKAAALGLGVDPVTGRRNQLPWRSTQPTWPSPMPVRPLAGRG